MSGSTLDIDSSDSSLSHEDAELALGPRVVLVSLNDNNYDAEDAIKTVLETPANSGTTLTVPKNKVNDFNKAVKAHLVCQSRRVIEGSGWISFWYRNEPYMRPALSRSLSLP
ncbi:hypothetical protein PNOK_0248500 [Pyrrhoderma noxium]|uniref:Uncharacterized protein n=1 Tax=Pyrrhoderma noxium TaxID=2282107 RepID=A0A286USG7_9AGAM|nr:hypothetical protein PNOK_0248500 [Pyrrhoderma noxium]